MDSPEEESDIFSGMTESPFQRPTEDPPEPVAMEAEEDVQGEKQEEQEQVQQGQEQKQDHEETAAAPATPAALEEPPAVLTTPLVPAPAAKTAVAVKEVARAPTSAAEQLASATGSIIFPVGC